jgi:hypothetical protein
MISVYLRDGTLERVEADSVHLEQSSLVCTRGLERTEVRRFRRADVLMYRRRKSPPDAGRACDDGPAF